MKKREGTLGGPLPYSHYDRRNYKTVSVEDGYAVWSQKYGDFYDHFDIDLFERSELVRSRVPGARVVDLACGNGRIGKWLKRMGASSIAGVDRSAEMLAHAVERGVYEQTLLADVAATGLPERSFDGAITSMALCHVADLRAFFREAARLLRPGGWLATLDFHPFFLFMGVPTHFDPLDGSETLAIENHVHAMSHFFQAARDAGFTTRDGGALRRCGMVRGHAPVRTLSRLAHHSFLGVRAPIASGWASARARASWSPRINTFFFAGVAGRHDVLGERVAKEQAVREVSAAVARP